MKYMRILRICIQLAALAAFGYQMVVAGGKYFSDASYPTVETVDIKDATLPDIYVCLLDVGENLKNNGYIDFMHFMMGSFVDSSTELFITWEGMNNLTYTSLTGILSFSFCINLFT